MLVATFLIVTVLAYTEEDSVLVLTDGDFPSIFDSFPKILIEFYAPWCGHCKKLAPVYKEAAAELKNLQSSIRLAKVDCDSEEQAKEKYGIKGFPTLIYFDAGNQIPYGGGRTKQAIVQWLRKRELPALAALTLQGLNQLKANVSDAASIVFYGNPASPSGILLSSFAQKDDENKYFYVQGSSVAQGTIEIFRNFGENVILTQINKQTEKQIALQCQPSVVQFNERAIRKIFGERKNALLFFNVGDNQKLSSVFGTVAENWRLKLKNDILFSEMKSESEHFAGLSDYIQVKPSKYPLVYIIGQERKKVVFESAQGVLFTEEEVLQFLRRLEEKTHYGLDKAIPGEGKDIETEEEENERGEEQL